MAAPAPARTSSPSKARLRLWIALLRATRGVESELRNRLRRHHDVTLPRFDVLAALDRFESGMLMSELSRFLMVSNGNVTGIVDRLVEDGLVLRAPRRGDRRASVVRLTARGRTRFAELAAAHEGWVDELLRAVDPREAAAMVDDLAAIRGSGGEEA